jgi:hypothetical protein
MAKERIKTFVGRKTRWFCNRCRTETNHTCKTEHFPTDLSAYCFEGEEDGPKGLKYWGIDHFYRLWICNGCEDALLEIVYGGCRVSNSKGQSWLSDTELEIELHPHRTEGSVPVRHFVKLPHIVANSYYETVFAHHHSLYLLCALGLRNLIEAICFDQSIAGRNLEEKIAGLKKVMPAAAAEKFHILRIIGNEAAHEFKEPKPEDLRLGIEICEDVLNFLYELEHRVSTLVRNRQDPHR